nr:archaeosine tRNA-ribosyltransferase [Methanobacterium alcaliphilum]
MPFDVPRGLAQWSVEKTLKNAANIEDKLGVIQGSKYVDLRVYCAQKLEKMGFNTLVLANADELMRRPRELADIIVHLRENLSPNTSLVFPFADASFIPVLCYMGVDFFSDAICEFYSYLNIIMTPSNSYSQEKYQIYNLDQVELAEYNKNTLDLVVREVQTNIENGTLRNLVEERSCSSPQNMSLVRILDKEHINYLKKYTPIH